MVAITGHNSGFTGDYAAVTNAGGRYQIRHVFVGDLSVVVVLGRATR